jgi:hypothetical protein
MLKGSFGLPILCSFSALSLVIDTDSEADSRVESLILLTVNYNSHTLVYG